MNVLINTLGTAAPVITETITALYKQKKIKIDRLHIIHTTGSKVYSNKVGNYDVGLKALQKYMRKHYSFCKLFFHSLKNKDINSIEDNYKLLNIMSDLVLKEKGQGNKIYVSIAGGRKTMSSIALFAAYLFGCDGIFHILVSEDEWQLTAKYGFAIPAKYLNLITLPQVDLSYMLNSVLKDSFGKDLGSFKGSEISHLLDRLNAKLANNLNLRKLKEEYDKSFEIYSLMCNTVESILSSRRKQLNIIKPIFEKRVKTFESILDKILRKEEKNEKISDPFERIKDIAGVRVICYFREDANQICKIIKEGKDFEIIQPKRKTGTFSYKGNHFIVKLKRNRISLIEYEKLKNIKCEIQVKTIFSHAWAQLHHRLLYKSVEYENLPPKRQEFVRYVFAAGSVQLEDTEKLFSRLRIYYKNI